MKKLLIASGIFLIAASSVSILGANGNSPLYRLKASNPANQQRLTAENRDALVTEVENLKAQLSTTNNNTLQIPSGAIMAFNLTNCPSGWKRFSAADDRFLMGTDPEKPIIIRTGIFGRNKKELPSLLSAGGSSQITLSVGQLPPHHHKLAGARKNGHDNEVGRLRSNGEKQLLDVGNRSVDVDGGGAEDTYYQLKATNQPATIGRSSEVGNGDPINILNPYIKVLYCQKI